MKWPTQLRRVTSATVGALKQCDAQEAREVADYLLKVGMEVVASTTGRPLIMLVQSTPMERLLVAISSFAMRNNLTVDDVAASLISKLGPDGVEDTKLN